MKTFERSDVIESAEENFVDAYSSVSNCMCSEGRHLQIALSEQRTRPIVYAPGHMGLTNAYCATFDRRCK